MKNKSQTIRVTRGFLWKAESPMSIDADGVKTHLCWPSLEDMAWYKQLQDILAAGDTPRYVTHQNGKFTWHFIRDCWHGDEGWWYRWDTDRSANRPERYRMFIPSELKFHPDYTEEVSNDND